MIFSLFVYGMIGFAILLVFAAIGGAIMGLFEGITGIDLREKFPRLFSW